MQFYDEVSISVESGKGGDGIVNGRRESGVPLGGPSGGNGGRGGSIIFKASKDENTLLPYRYRKIFKAKPGDPGRSKDQYGANAENLVLPVPVGTLVRDKNTGEFLHIFKEDGEERCAVRGGDGGVGNMHFKNAVRQFPNFCLLGEPGHEKEVVLELQLLADVGLIGTPSVGKSSLINAISHTKAKVADYPFTTLIPNLGSTEFKGYHFNVIDIPGLIEGAAEGKGLGNAFLRHVLKAKVFCLMADISRYEPGMNEIPTLLNEIFLYIDQKFDSPKVTIIQEDDMITLYAKKDDEILLEKRLMFLVNKYDLINDTEILEEYKKQFFEDIIAFFKSKKIGTKITKTALKKNTFTISAATHLGIDTWLTYLVELLKNTDANEVYHIPEGEVEEKKSSLVIKDISDTERELLLENGYLDPVSLKYNKIRSIDDYEICKLVWILPWGNDEAEQWFWGILHHKGVTDIFEEYGIKKGDVLKIISHYPGKNDRYILY